MKQKKRGFTLVELVIVIAVIAILAGVMIAVFSNVVNDAKDAAKEQEAKQAEQNQKIDDITKKLENADWLSWEDFESKFDGLEVNAATKDDVQKVVEAALKEYAESANNGNTGLTEEQVATIIQRAMANQLTSSEVQKIVNRAVSSIKIPSGVTASQITNAVESALRNTTFVTTSDVKSAVTEALGEFKLADADIAKIADEVAGKTLSAAEVELLLQKYYRNGVFGNYAWYEEGKTAYTFTAENAADQLKSIAGLVADGENFSGVTITLPADATIDVSSTIWKAIGADGEFKGTIDGNGATISGVTLPATTTIKDANMLNCSSTGNQDKFAIGFIAYLGKGATLKNITLEVNYEVTSEVTDGIQLGGAVGYLDGGTLENVKVKGMVKGAHRVGGVVGAMSSGTIKNCTNEATVITTGCGVAEHKDRVSVGGIVGYYRNFDKNQTVEAGTISGCTNKGTLNFAAPETSYGTTKAFGFVIGDYSNSYVAGCNITSCTDASSSGAAAVGRGADDKVVIS